MPYWIRDIANYPQYVKWFFQRLFRGYADCDLWGLNVFIVQKIYPALKAFIDKERQSASMMFLKNDDESFDIIKKRQEEVYQKILFAFEYYLYDSEELSKKEARRFEEKYGDPYAETKANKKESMFSDRKYMYMDMDMLESFGCRVQEGMELFGKYFGSLWY
jgi:hypothetical protein